MSSLFFNGRLYTSPTTVAAVNDSALANDSLSAANNLAILGPSTAGQPNTPLVFGTPSQAQAVLQSGDLLTAVMKAFAPSAQTGGPASVTAIRVNPAVQAALPLADATTAASINLTATDYGAYTNQIKVKVESGSTAGKKLTTQLGTAVYSQDNITRQLMQVQYTGGQATATMTITGTSIVLSAPTGTPVATIDLTNFTTVQKVVDRINAVGGFLATVQGGNGALTSTNGFDYITAQDVLTAPYIALAVLQACIDWFNTTAEQFVNAARASNAGLPPANIGFTYLIGGTDGTITNTQWSNGYTQLQTVDAQWVVPASSDPSIHAMNDAHCQFMSTIGKSERRGIVGMALGSSDAAALAEALTLNSDRTTIAHIGMYDFDLLGNLTLYPAYIVAAMVGGMFAGSSPGTPMTNKALAVRGLERILLNPTDTDPLIRGGVMPIESTLTGFKIVQSITTWLVNSNFNRVEASVGAAVDYVTRSCRIALDVLRGGKNNQIALSRAVSITESTLTQLAVPDPQGPGVLAGNAASPPFKNISATLVGDRIQVQFQASPVLPTNYVTITIYAVPFSGTLSI